MGHNKYGGQSKFGEQIEFGADLTGALYFAPGEGGK
jgi:hypothetical protein